LDWKNIQNILADNQNFTIITIVQIKPREQY